MDQPWEYSPSQETSQPVHHTYAVTGLHGFIQMLEDKDALVSPSYKSTSTGLERNEMPTKTTFENSDGSTDVLTFEYFMKQEISIMPILLGVFGTVDSTSSGEVLETILNKKKFNKGFSSHYIIVTTGDRRLIGTANDEKSLYNFGIESYHEQRRQFLQCLEAPEDNYGVLAHKRDILEFLTLNKKNEKTNNNAAALISCIKRKRISLIKLWNISLSTNVMYFLQKFTGHLSYLHMWLFTDLPNATADEKDKHSDWGTILECFLKSLKICDVSELRHHCRLFGRHSKNDSINEEEMETLNGKVQSIASQLKVNRCLYEESIDISGTDFLPKLKSLPSSDIGNLVAISLSMLFLRGMLENEDSMFINYSQLKELAKKCHLENLDEFCKLFTSFGSIFYLHLIDSKLDIVIIKPDLFLAKINEICDCKERNKEYTRHGIMKLSDVQTLFKLEKEGRTFMQVLCDVGMAVVIPAERYIQDNGTTNSESCYYMPCLRDPQTQDLSTDNNSVHLLLNIQNSPNFVNFEVFITKFLMDKKDAIHLLSSENENITLLRNVLENVKIKFKYKGNRAEISMTSGPNSSIENHIKYLLEAFRDVAIQVTANGGHFTYAIAVICHSTTKEYHVLPYYLCDECVQNEYFYSWRRVLLTEELLPVVCTLNTAITLNDVIYLAKELSSCKLEVLKSFDRLLNDDDKLTPFAADEKNEESLWAYVMHIIVRWMRTEPNGVARSAVMRKGDLARKMLQLRSTKPDETRLKNISKELFKRVIKEANTTD